MLQIVCVLHVGICICYVGQKCQLFLFFDVVYIWIHVQILILETCMLFCVLKLDLDTYSR